MPLPQHERFLTDALPRLQADPRLVGVAVGGSWISDSLDEFSDLDLVIAVELEAFETVMGERQKIARALGPLLVGFTGEHVGEPRLLICLYGPPPLHVDLKFVALPDLARRVEDPVILFERDVRLTATLAQTEAAYPPLDAQWLEDRFWVWLHYGVSKIGRGELFEALDMLDYLRMRVLGPLLQQKYKQLPRGVRRIEEVAPADMPELCRTLAGHDARQCLDALTAATEMYDKLRAPYQEAGRLIPNREAEAVVREYLREIAERRIPIQERPPSAVKGNA